MDSAIYNAYNGDNFDQVGGELAYFVGKQYGNGWLRNLAKVAFPILKRLVGVAGRAAKDVIYNERPVLDAVKDSAMSALTSFAATKGAELLTKDNESEQRQGRGIARKSLSTINRRRQNKKLKSRRSLFKLLNT
jgi:hypothetical protein